jgi:Mn2+/Fe2+ NRAMP family transporter
MSSSAAPDPYRLDPEKVEDPPTTLVGSLKHIGPGFVLSASIVGSGELVATTTLGAKAGFIALWVILVSCLVKVAVQVEFGKHAILTGKPTFASLNLLPGPRIGRANWTIWTWLFLMIFKFLQVGAIIGMVAVLLNMAMPALSVEIWLVVTVLVVGIIVSGGYYRVIEGLSVLMIGLFTIFTLISLIALQMGPEAVKIGEVLSGLTFSLPSDNALMLLVIGAFGITGVGGDEIMAYNYWLIEKGYAAKTGECDGSDEWARRAKGWTKVMLIDAVAAMLVYTIVTAAFYVLGAGLLHGRGEVPESGGAFLKHLATMYTTTLGDWAGPLFFFGAFVVLFSTTFAALAAWTRQFSDAFGQVGLFDFSDIRKRRRWITALAWVIPIIWAIVFKVVQKPVFMVFAGGFVTSIILLVVLYAAIYFKKRHADPRMDLGKGFTVWFWASAVLIILVGIWSAAKPFLNL